MTIKDVKDAFQEAVGSQYSCTMALMDMVREHGAEFQVLRFRGNDPDGAEFEIISDHLRGDTDLIQAAKDTAGRLLKEKKAEQE